MADSLSARNSSLRVAFFKLSRFGMRDTPVRDVSSSARYPAVTPAEDAGD